MYDGKLITFAIPSYNSEAYLGKCIESLLVAGEEAEIIVVNDGSTDGTAAVGQSYADKYPTIVRVINKENGGHGSGVNRGLKEAKGLFYKVVDSDDWLDADALTKFMNTLRSHVEKGEEADLYITNFVYEHVLDNTSYVSDYVKKMPHDKFITWNDVKPFRLWKMLLMHSLIYKTEKARSSGVELPEHTFYVDNLYAFQPLPHMKKIYYMNVDLYRYYIGRSDQSVTIENMVKRYKQQIRVMTCMLNAYTYDEIKAMPKRLAKMMFHDLESIMLNTIFFTTNQDDPERRQLLNGLWSDLKARDKKMYKKLKHHTKVKWLNLLSWRGKGRFTTFSYKFLCKHVKLGA